MWFLTSYYSGEKSRHIIRVKQIAESRAVYSFVSIFIWYLLSLSRWLRPLAWKQCTLLPIINGLPSTTHRIFEKESLGSSLLSDYHFVWPNEKDHLRGTHFTAGWGFRTPQGSCCENCCHIEGSCDLSETRMVLKQKYKRHAPLI